jgi:hypothetical protein
MTRPDDSLIARRAEQVAAAPPLFSAEVLDALASAEARGEFTGERLFSQRPDIYRAVVELLGQGVGVRQISRTLRVSHNTIAAVRHREGQTVDTLKEQTIATLARFVGAASERLLEEVQTIKLESLPVALGIAAEKLLLLSGQATQRIAHVDEAPQVPAFAAWLQEKKADAVEIESETVSMGFSGRERGQRAAAAAAAAAGADVAQAAPQPVDQAGPTDGADRAADSESAAFGDSTRVMPVADTLLDTPCASETGTAGQEEAAPRRRKRQATEGGRGSSVS